MFQNFVKWFVYIYTFVACITLIGMKSCIKFLRILVTTVYFEDQN